MKGRAAYTHSPKQKLEVAEKSSLSFGRTSLRHSLKDTVKILQKSPSSFHYSLWYILNTHRPREATAVGPAETTTAPA